MKKVFTLLLLFFAAIISTSQTWENVGSPSFSPGSANYTSLAFDSSGTPYVAYADGSSGNGNKASVMKYYENSWHNVGAPAFSAGAAIYTSLALNSSGTPYVAYRDYAYNEKAVVMKFDGNSWVNVGNPGFSGGWADYISLALDPSGTPYVVYQDQSNSYRASVMRFNGISWEYVGMPGFSAGTVYYTSIAFDALGAPYVAYRDSAYEHKAVVMKFNGISWVNVGTPPLSTSQVEYTSIAINASGVPYMACRDFAYNDKAVVKKFNGTSWVNVGAPGFSAGYADYISLAINPSGTPYIAYQDQGSADKASVMKFNGTSWVNVGAPGFSQGGSNYISLDFGPSGSPYVAYRDGATGRATVMKFTETVCEDCLPTTQLAPPYCGVTISKPSDELTAIPVSGAQQYRFRVSHDGITDIFTKNDNSFRLTILSSCSYNTEYTIDVAVKIDDEWGEYGPACTVTTPTVPLTQLSETDCGSTITNLDTYLHAEYVDLSQGYRFRVTDGTNVQLIASQSYFKLTEVTIFQYNTTYTIEVAVKVNNVYGAYGPECTVTSPPVPICKLNDTSCGSTISSFSTNLYAFAVPMADGYRFRITNGANVQIFDTNNRYFRLNQLTSYQYDTTYTVEVAARINGIYSSYGPACTVTSPTAQHTQLNSASCNITVPDFSMNLYATSVPSVTGYRFRVTNGGNVQTIQGTASYFRLNQLASYQYSTFYTVEVAVSVGGVYGSYGPACTVTTPAPPLTQLRAQDCGITVAGFGTNVYANEVVLAEGYRFRVTHDAIVDIVDWPTRNFRIKMLPVYTYNTTYGIEVAVMINGVYGPYGASCNVSTPASGMRQNVANDEDTDSGFVRELAIFPNPFETSFAFTLETERDEPVHIKAYDISGKILDDMTVNAEELEYLRLGTQYAAGIYSVTVTQGSYGKTVKMVKK